MAPRVASDHIEALRERIASRTARVCVVGMGYVGLPLAHAFVHAGFQVVGFDIDEDKVAALGAGQSYIAQFPDDVIEGMVATERFSATSAAGDFAEADAILICVPTPLTRGQDPDLSYVEATGRAIAEHLRPGQLIVLESTTYPGTTDRVLQPILETSGLSVEKDFFLAYSPEREDPGRKDHTTRTIPKVVGACGPVSHELACALYAGAVDTVVPVASSRVAEASKILENTYRAVNIALVNELKVLFQRMDVDIWDVIEAAKTKPFGYQAFYPGPGLGGHCIPIDPFYLSWLARQLGTETRFIDLAGRVNTEMPSYVVRRINDVLNAQAKALKDSRILILGISYKEDIDDSRESPAFPIMRELIEAGAQVRFNDPFFSKLPGKRDYDMEVASVPLTAEVLAEQDCVVIVTAHSSYDYAWISEHAPTLVDTRGVTRGLPGADDVHRA